MNGFIADIRHAVRIYLATPVSSAMALIMLAIAMACVSSFLSLYSDLALKVHPGFESAGEIVTIGRNDGENFMPLTKNLIESIRDEMATLASITGAGIFTLELDPGGEDQPVEFVPSEFFATMRPRLELGRAFDRADHSVDAEPVTVLSNAYWREHFGASPDAIGQTIRITGRQSFVNFAPGDDPRGPEESTVAYRIVGVMSESMPSTFDAETAVWVPFEQAATIFLGEAEIVNRFTLLMGFARLDRDVGLGPVIAEINDRYGDRDEEFRLLPGARYDAMRGVVRNVGRQRAAERQVRLLLIGGVLLALVAAANVSLFLLSRAPGRRRELGVRMAVGAPLKRIARQLATEAGLLVVVAAVLGLFVAAWLNVLLPDLAFLEDAQWKDVSLDWRVLILVSALTLLLSGLVSLGPAFGIRRMGLAASARAVTARPGPTQQIAGNAQIGIACVLTAVATAFGWYLATLVAGHHGYETDEIVVVTQAEAQDRPRLDIDFANILAERERRRQAVEAIPGVDAVAFGTGFPGQMNFGITARMEKADDPGEYVGGRIVSIDDDYVGMLGMRIVHGRALEESDRYGMLVNETLARAMWGRTDVAGEALPGFLSGGDATAVVGVLEDVSFEHPNDEADSLAFVYATPFAIFESILVRTSMSPADLRAAVQTEIDAGTLEIDIGDVERLSDITARVIVEDRARSLVAVATAVLVVVLAVFGFYGTQRYLVTAGRREFAILAALGAGPKAIGRLVMRRALLLGAPGLGFGTVTAFIIVAWMRDEYVTDVVPPLTVTILVLLAIASLLVAASMAPARAARNTDAGPLLKQE